MSKLFAGLVFLSFIAAVFGQQSGYPINQYEEQGLNVDELNSNSFNNKVHCLNTKVAECSAFVVNFYNSTSEASNNFTESYKNAAIQTDGWEKNILKFAAVNCFTPSNFELCKLHGYTEAPLVKYFVRQSPVSHFGITIQPDQDHTLFLRRIAAQINQEYWTNLYTDWPNFNELPNYVNLSNDIWEGLHVASCSLNYFLIIVQDMDDFVGMDILIQTRKLADSKLPIRRVLNDHEVVKLMNGTAHLPEPIMFKRPPFGICQEPVGRRFLNYKDIFASMGITDTESYNQKYENGTIIIERRNNPYVGKVTG